MENSQTQTIAKANFSPNDVVLLKGNGNYTWIYMTNGSRKLLCKTMHTILDEFHQMQFVRTHKSYSVNINHIRSQDMVNDHTLVMTNGMVVEVSRRKKKEFLSMVNLKCYIGTC
jgi:two-component system LytT family response regulator